MAKKSQIDKFHEKARELEASEDEATFDAALRKMAHGTPKEQQEGTDEMAEIIGQREDGSPKDKAKPSQAKPSNTGR